MSKSAVVSPTQNRLLAALTPEVFERLLPDLELVPMALGKVIYESGVELTQVYFPVPGCIVSMLYVMEDGSSAEIAVVGDEGMIGIALFMGGGTTPSRALVQSGGQAFQLRAKSLTSEFERHTSLQALLLRYTQALITQMSQTAVYTDSVGSDDFNQGLSQRRADSVQSYLAGQGVALARLSSSGKGEGNPVAGNDSVSGRQQNRRVEVIISNQVVALN